MVKRKTLEQKKEEVKDLTTKMNDAIDYYFESPEQMNVLMAFMLKFYHYSPKNAALIRSQFEGAQAVGSYNFWKEKGFQVQKGEKALKVLVPNKTALKFKTAEGKWKNIKYATEQEKERIDKGELEQRKSQLYFSTGNVFDISQTNAKESDLPEIFPNKWMEGDVANYKTILGSMHRIGDKLDVTIGEPFDELGTAKGAFYHSVHDKNNGHIGLNPRNGELQNVKTLLHELAHAKLHNPKNEEYRAMLAEEKEFQAEMTAYAIASYFDIDTSDYSLRYLANWTQDKDIKNKAKLLADVRETAVEFIDEMEPDLVKERDKEQEHEKNMILLEYGFNHVTDIKEISLQEIKDFAKESTDDDTFNKMHASEKLTDEEYLKQFNEVFTDKYAVIDKTIDEPQLLIQWSEAPELKDNTMYPFAEVNEKMETLEEKYGQETGYRKTRYHVVLPANEHSNMPSVVSVPDRLDIGDGAYVNPYHHIRKAGEMKPEHQTILDDAYHDRLIETEKQEMDEWMKKKQPKQTQNKYDDGLYWYEMCNRPVSLGCQPKGFLEFDDDKGKHGIVAYDRKLTEKELNDFEMKERNLKEEKERDKEQIQKLEMKI
ncbi:LPD25 domain-containing protein [Lentibacillus salicampi]|uniref:ImmA/IrrE family metallo-endopeptidase n=1 Tax=Lentibacillus salicampi TaxID=175306 RepID=A0A4Y9A7U1_9BACI|nr:LPD25 domain-containing protein [Lentibacillus salicampi]TFJ91535.1 ImmA/IrrE family metallo-endopeptidase [Lentibacillus salicampi]